MWKDSASLRLFITVFQPYQDDGRVILKSYAQSVYDWKEFCFKHGTKPRPLDQQASTLPTKLPGLHN